MTDKVEDEVSLRDEIAAAFKDTQEGDVIDKQGDLARDESGKFAKKEPEAKDVKESGEAKDLPKKVEVQGEGGDPSGQPKDKTDVQPPQDGSQQNLLTHEKPPQSWAPKARERWGEIPEDIRKEIIRREEASALGVRQLQESFAPAKAFINDIGPYIQEALQANVNPSQYIGQVLASERTLRTGNSEQKFEALIGIADNYGIPLRQILTDALGKDVLPAPKQQMQLPPEIQRELQEARQFRQQYESQRQTQTEELPPELVQFKKNNEFFEDVRMDMADLIEAGRCKTLDEAYKEACWRNPDVRELLLERQGSGADRQQRQKAASQPGKVSSTSSVEATPKDDHDKDDDIRETVRKAAAAHANNRV